MATPPKWQLSGDYFENCNCSVVCPCLVSTAAPLTSKPTQGVCDVALIFHIDKGNYGDVRLDGLNVAMVAHTPGPMANGNWTAAAVRINRIRQIIMINLPLGLIVIAIGSTGRFWG